jgi:chaperonin GroES
MMQGQMPPGMPPGPMGGMPQEQGGMPPQMGQPPEMAGPHGMEGQEPPEGMQEDPQEDQFENYLDAALSNTNLAKKLRKKDPDLLKEIGEAVYTGWEVDERSRDEWMERNNEWLKLALLVRENKSFPWPTASNVKYPLLATAAMQFSARAYPALVPSDGNVVKAKVIPKDVDGQQTLKAIRVAKHMSYQVMEKMPNWEEDMDKLLMTMAITGICFKKTYHNQALDVHHSHLVLPENLCINYWAKSIEKAYRKTEILHYTKNEYLEKVNNDEEFLEIELPDQFMDDQLKSDLETSAVSTSDVDKSTPYVFLAQHTFWDLDDDGYEEPYIIVINKATKEVVRIIARWDSDGVHMDPEGKKVIRIEPVEYFTAFPFIPNPDGSMYALGFGTLMAPLNESINSIINQLIDAGTLNNLQGGFIGKGLRIKMGISSFQPGEWKVVNATGEDLQKSIFPLPTKEPSGVLMSLLNMLITSGNQLASIAEIMVGKMPGQNTPATTTQETVKQGMAVFTAIYKRVYRSMASEFKKIYRLNRITPSALEEAIEVLGEPLQMSDYDDDNLIIPGGDPSGDSTATRQAKIDQIGQLISLGRINVDEFTKYVLESNEIPQFERFIAPPAPPPPDPKMEALKMKGQIDQQKASMDMQKTQADVQAKMQDAELKKQLGEMKIQMEALKLQFDQQRQAMELQGQQAEKHMNLVAQARDQQFQQQKAQGDLVVTGLQQEQAIRHAEQTHQQAMKQARQVEKARPKKKKE